MILDLADLQLWQGLVGIVGLLGLSPAPWILGLATNRIGFTSAFTVRIEELKGAHQRTLDQMTASHAAAVAEIVRHHADLDRVKDEAHAETRQSRDYYRAARIAEADRADAATDKLAEFVEVAKVNMKMLGAIDEAARVKP